MVPVNEPEITENDFPDVDVVITIVDCWDPPIDTTDGNADETYTFEDLGSGDTIIVDKDS